MSTRMRLAVLGGAAIAIAIAFGLVGPGGRIALGAAVVLAAFVGVPVALLRRWRWRIAGGFGGLIAFVALVLVIVRLRYGGGEPYPDTATAPALPETALVKLVALDYPPGNVAVAGDGRVFVNYHPFARAERFSDATMFELVGGALRPYPDAAFQARYQGVFGMTIDRRQRLWLIEPASLDHDRTRVLAFDLATNALVFEHWFPSGEARFAQDLRIAPDGATAYLADTGLFRFTAASLIVLDLATRTHRRVLDSTPATQPQDWIIRTPAGTPEVAFGLVTFAVGIDGLDLTPDGAWLYFGAMSHDHLYKVPTAALRDPALAEDALAALVVEVGRKPLSDGIALAADGSVLITDIEHGGLARLDPGGRLTTLVRSPAIGWADGVAIAPDGAIVFTDSAIPRYLDPLGRPPSAASLEEARPYWLYRVARPAL